MSHKILKKIDKLLLNLELLESYKENCEDRFLKDSMFEGALLHYLYVLSDGCISLAEMVIKKKGLMRPDSYYESITILGQYKIIPRDFAYSFAGIASFRNFLAHDYDNVDSLIVCKTIIEKLDEVREYLDYIKEAVN